MTSSRDRRHAAAPSSFGLPDAWWPVALSAEVGTAPYPSRLGGVDLVLYREPAGPVRALRDCCPHRRMPLSMGRVTAEGILQCGYHGWCFDGATGQCVSIPNLSADEKVSASIRVAAFATVERWVDRLTGRPHAAPPLDATPLGSADLPNEQALSLYDAALADGLVFVWTGPSRPEGLPVSVDETGQPPRSSVLHGAFEARAPYTAVSEALLFNPGKALGLAPLLGGGEEAAGPQVRETGDAVVVRRERLTLDLPRGSTYDALSMRTTTVRISTRTDVGLTRVESEPLGGGAAVEVVVGLSPLNEYRTMVRWHAGLVGQPTVARRGVVRAVRTAVQLRPSKARAIEALVDGTDLIADPAVSRLRELRRGAGARARQGVVE